MDRLSTACVTMEYLQAEYVAAIDHLSSAGITMEDLQAEYVLHAGLQSDADKGVPKSQPHLKDMDDARWNKSISGEMENFLQREAWKLVPQSLYYQEVGDLSRLDGFSR